jgi:hypothetical protein
MAVSAHTTTRRRSLELVRLRFSHDRLIVLSLARLRRSVVHCSQHDRGGLAFSEQIEAGARELAGKHAADY